LLIPINETPDQAIQQQVKAKLRGIPIKCDISFCWCVLLLKCTLVNVGLDGLELNDEDAYSERSDTNILLVLVVYGVVRPRFCLRLE
jgi:hypothetical protein